MRKHQYILISQATLHALRLQGITPIQIGIGIQPSGPNIGNVKRGPSKSTSVACAMIEPNSDNKCT